VQPADVLHNWLAIPVINLGRVNGKGLAIFYVFSGLLLYLMAAFLYAYWEADAATMGNNTGSPVWCGCFGCTIDPMSAFLLYAFRAAAFFIIVYRVLRLNLKTTLLLLLPCAFVLESIGSILSGMFGAWFWDTRTRFQLGDRSLSPDVVLSEWSGYVILGAGFILAIYKVAKMYAKEMQLKKGAEERDG
jgi:hypothetical protein